MNLVERIPGTTAWRDRRARRLCHETAERIQEIVDGELPPSRKVRLLERHLKVCGFCGTEADVVRRLKNAIARAAADADPDTVDRLNQLARRLCEGAGPPAP